MQQCIFDRMYCDYPQNTIASTSSKDLSTRVNINGSTTHYHKLGLSKDPRTELQFTKTRIPPSCDCPVTSLPSNMTNLSYSPTNGFHSFIIIVRKLYYKCGSIPKKQCVQKGDGPHESMTGTKKNWRFLQNSQS